MKSIIDFLKKAPKKDLLVIGDIMLDEYLFGSTGRISPEAPVPVVLEDSREFFLGGAANVASNCAAIGFDTQLIGIINATDFAGEKIISLLNKAGIKTTGIISSYYRSTTSKQRIIAQNQQCIRIDREVSYTLTQDESVEVFDRIEQLIRPNMTVLISDYAKGVVSEAVLAFIISKAEQYNLRIIVDPKGPNFLKYTGVDYIKPNFSEYKQLVAQLKLSLSASIEVNCRQLCEILRLKGIIVTLGDQGIWYVDKEEAIHVPAVKQEVYDLSGAGDTVLAFIALTFAHNISIVDSLKIANKAASIAIAHFKTYAVTLDELANNLPNDHNKIYFDWSLLKKELDILAQVGKKIVFTNGCFDILHVGHIKLLREAKRLGAILVVALNSDDSVRRLNKGPERPINELADRAFVMAALTYVDFVVTFDQDTPQVLIDYLKPHVLVKGGDYQLHEIVGADTVIAYGGEVFIIDLVAGKSTTGILNRANKYSSVTLNNG